MEKNWIFFYGLLINIDQEAFLLQTLIETRYNFLFIYYKICKKYPSKHLMQIITFMESHKVSTQSKIIQ